MESIDQSLKSLFVDLQTSGIWEDEKAIADSILKRPAKEILELYLEFKDTTDFNLEHFFHEHFAFLQDPAVGFQPDAKRSPKEHIESLWPFLRKSPDAPERSTRVPLPKSYVVPGGRFQEVYYWDSFFTQLGLLRSGKAEWVEDILDNFTYLIQKFGHIPNGNRTYFLSRSQPPFFALMVDEYARVNEEPDRIYQKYFEAILEEYNFWTKPVRNKKGLTHYYDAMNGPRVEMYGTDLKLKGDLKKNPLLFRHLRAACESGWDFSSRWFEDPMDITTAQTCDILPVDLNSLLFFYEELLFKLSGSQFFADAAQQRKKTLQTIFFNIESGFHDYNHITKKQTPAITAATLYPLFVGAATPLQGDIVARVVRHTLLQPGGLSTTTLETGQQWDAPNGWAPLQWVAVQGLHNYGHTQLALDIAKRWVHTCNVVYEAKGKFVEKYNVFEPENLSAGGEYELQDGFGWSNGVYLALLDFIAQHDA